MKCLNNVGLGKWYIYQLIHGDGYLDELEHYGRKGQKWGVRRGPPYPIESKSSSKFLQKTLTRSKTSNVNKWGKDKDSNILYIAGYSGSGKTTLANFMADRNTDIIHLDVYFDKSLTDKSNKNFDEYLKSIGLKKPNEYSSKQQLSQDIFDRFEKALEDFGKQQYKNKRKVIAEGVQILDTGLYLDKKYYKDKPVILLTTPIYKSLYRAINRNSKLKDISFWDSIGGFDGAKRQLQFYLRYQEYFNEFVSATNLKSGKKYFN